MHIRSYLGVNFGAYEFALFALNFILKDGMIDGYFREWFLMPDIVEILCELFLVIEQLIIGFWVYLIFFGHIFLLFFIKYNFLQIINIMNFIIVFWTILDCKRVFHLITVITNNKLKYKMIEFLFSVITLINTYITITLYDLLFLLIISFQVGYLFARRNILPPSSPNFQSNYYHQQPSQNVVPLHSIYNQPFQQDSKEEENNIFSSLDDKKQKKLSDTQSSQNEFFLEKIKLQGKKIQERGLFSMYFQRNSQNISFIRKVQKHQIITDYLLQKQVNKKAILPLDNSMLLPDENSILQVDYFLKKGYNPEKKPVLQKRIINLSDLPNKFSHMFFQNGKFKKIFRNGLKIGQGSFGTVLSAFNIVQGKQYALKKIYLKNPNKKMQEFYRLMGQIKILSNLSHPNITRYHTCWIEQADLSEQSFVVKQFNISQSKSRLRRKNKIESYEMEEQISYVSSNSGFSFGKRSENEENQKALVKKQAFSNDSENQKRMHSTYVLYVQMQLYQKGTLASFLKKRKRINRRLCFRMMEQLINGVEFLHEKRIVHRDLKPENIFLQKQEMALKIGDFGLSLFLDEKSKEYRQKVGTHSYMAPQLFDNMSISEQDLYKADVFALGVIYFEMLSVFETAHEKIEKIQNLKEGKISGIDEFEMQKKLIKLMIKRRNRPFISLLKNHKILKELKERQQQRVQ